MTGEPALKRAVAFIDGQNLFHAAKEAFGHRSPNYDPLTLAQHVCEQQGWDLKGCNFYTGIPTPEDNAYWHEFWTTKLSRLGRRGVRIYTRSLRYRNQTVSLPSGTKHTFLVAEEKGIDVRIALDTIHLAYHNEYDVALLFSQDQDLSEVADQIRLIAQEQGRWLKIASAFPVSPASRNHRGINGTDWIPIARENYNDCLDSTDPV